ncbi:MAG TPA: DUF2905 domain-containing protein [Candidatus Kapabacteria bacterium]|nr:DUF2905 domain-containing protein [Candidatus Kapabacteria bacterium]
MGKGMLMLGFLLVAAGLVILYAPGLLSWFGKLPGDIRVESGNGSLFIPFTSMALVSLVATIVLTLLGRD